MGEPGSFWQLERVNRRRTRALVAKLILWLAAFGLALDFLFHNLRFTDGRLSGIPWITEAALLLAVVQALRANFSGADLVLGALDAHPISSDDPKNQTVIDVVREIALAARIPEPRVDLIDDPSPNAFAIGRDPEHSVICVTQGLLDQMDREELQGVIAHETAHIRDYDTQLVTMVTAMFGGFGVFRFIFGIPTIWKSSSGGIIARVISRTLSREREYLADASAVEFTRNPKALLRALEQFAKTESPLLCATPGTAQLFIVDPLQSASGGGGRSYNEFINEITRIRSQADKSQEERDAEAKNFAAHEYPRNFVLERISSHPPLHDRIARLQALAGEAPSTAGGLTDAQLQAKFKESVLFVRYAASADPEVMAKVMQSALLASPVGRAMLQATIGATQTGGESTQRDPIEQKLYEANLASTGDLARSTALRPTAGEDFDPPRSLEQQLFEPAVAAIRAVSQNASKDSSLGADPASGKDAGLPGSATNEDLEREAFAKMLGPVVASLRRPKKPLITLGAAERPTGSRGGYLFWFVIAFSAAAIVASFAIK